MTEGVDVLQAALVQNLPALLGRRAHDPELAGEQGPERTAVKSTFDYLAPFLGQKEYTTQAAVFTRRHPGPAGNFAIEDWPRFVARGQFLIVLSRARVSHLAPVCGGPVEAAVITTDRSFRWVRHKRLDAVIRQGGLDER